MGKRKPEIRKPGEPPLLAWLEQEFARTRKQVTPLYPYDTQTNTIHLPPDVEKELRYLAVVGNKVQAVKRVTELTGAGLRLSKDYVDNLIKLK